jgi:hypothetical protein
MITRSLIEFIQKERSAGISKDRIVALLKEKGWKEADIVGGFSVIAEEGDVVAPVPPRTGFFVETCEMFSLVWKVYRSRWKRFVSIGALYVLALSLMELALFMWMSPTFFSLMGLFSQGRFEEMFPIVAPYAFVGMLGYILMQLWYVGALYAIALRKGDSFIEHVRAGLLNLPALFGIKFSIAVLLLIVFVPPLATAFLTQNPLVLFLFGPIFFMGAVALWFTLSLAVPAYFHGTPWRNAALTSIILVRKNALSLLGFFLSFGFLVTLLFIVVRDAVIITAPLAIGLVSPMQILLMVALYRRFSPQKDEVLPHSSIKPAAKTASEIFVKSGIVQVSSIEKTEKKRERRPRRVPKASLAA